MPLYSSCSSLNLFRALDFMLFSVLKLRSISDELIACTSIIWITVHSRGNLEWRDKKEGKYPLDLEHSCVFSMRGFRLMLLRLISEWAILRAVTDVALLHPIRTVALRGYHQSQITSAAQQVSQRRWMASPFRKQNTQPQRLDRCGDLWCLSSHPEIWASEKKRTR